MKYLMFVCVDESMASELSAEERAAIPRDAEAWAAEMDERGIRLQGNALEQPSDAKTLRKRSGRLVVTDGPFADTKEHIGGFDLLECADLDEAIEVASKHPCAVFGALEVRPLYQG